MEPFFCLLLLLLAVGGVMGIVANVRVGGLRRQMRELEGELKALRRHTERRGETLWPDRDEPPEDAEAEAGEPTNGGLVSNAFGNATAAAAAPPSPPPPPPAAPRPPIAAPPPTAAEPPRTPAPIAAPAPASIAPVAPAPVPEPAPERPAPMPMADRHPASSFEGVEKAFGLRWLTWVGVAMLFLGIAFFLKYAYDRDWLGRFFGPRLRIATAATLAVGLALAGWRSLRQGMSALGQGLLGGGQALLYLTVYAAFQPAVMVVDTPLVSATVAFALMVGITALGLFNAVRLDAIAIAFLAVLGGFATPVLVSSGQDARDALCAYLLLLDLGVLFVAARRSWRALDLLAFAGTAVLFGGWAWRWIAAHPQPDATIAWLAVFHTVFLVLPFVHHWRRGPRYRSSASCWRWRTSRGRSRSAPGCCANRHRIYWPRVASRAARCTWSSDW